MRVCVSSKIIVLLIGFSAAILVGARSAEADFTFGTPTNLGPVVNSVVNDHPAGMSADGLRLYFSSRRSGGYSEWFDIWVTTRPTIDDPWEEPVNLGQAVNTSRSEWEPDISPDELILVFTRVGTEYPDWDIWMSTRPTREDSWGQRVNLGQTINSYAEDMDPCISADGLTLYYNSRRSGGYGQSDILMTTRPTRNGPWSEAVNIGPPINTSFSDYGPEISADGRTLFFNSDRTGGLGGADLYVTRRPTINDPWGTPVNLGPVLNTTGREDYPAISADERLLLFSSSRAGGRGGTDIWQAPIIPVVDFNGDEIVDIEDLVKLIQYWGQDEPSVDIGPTPFGDGIVDVQDLEVLMSYWQQEVKDPTLIAHWALDETEGDIAQDSAGDNDAFVIGGPLWQPDGGQVDGALELDGVDDCVITGPILNPAEGPFSVFVWVRGGLQGQAVLSQTDRAGWLCIDPSEGNLMTELKGTGRSGGPMFSQTNITDGNWHRLVLVWDGSYRTLYVDDVLVAEDIQEGLVGSENGLYIGTGKAMEPGTYFSGLIDDVRIYKRVARP